ncbi:dTDP-4-dehydrorhamnose 3,5-epimerase family protein [Arenibaculum sp.]|jgi:dTDP-4-dehydrorhamnose 3,5-epimerase|uniref:dTDP-4-dehydrorhamnose 3,5-epimerase family protein n=1 Tax=Arenibaculum sp. TaxID=2865862 RepID=UPI002E0E6237|nr:dTDP-4-dehydrorhamnose 3,5-epimerase family protein [Arenibaculum sp.]
MNKVGVKRGFFVNVSDRRSLAPVGGADKFVQDNRSYSARRGTVRELHLQLAPSFQAKLMLVGNGSIFDVAVDLRRSSPTYSHHVGVVLSADRGEQVYIPTGSAHGFRTLEPDTSVTYKMSGFYSTEHEIDLRWDGPDIGVDWPVAGDAAFLPPKGTRLPRLREVTRCLF